MELLDAVGLAGVAHKMPAAVSGGQQQSAAIARALANDPPLIIADEPTGNLDSQAADHVFRLFEDLAAQGKTIIMVTHDESLANRATRKVLLVDGEAVDETVLRVLPLLSHRQMLEATKGLGNKRFAPGETIVTQGEQNDTFFMIARGYTDVIVQPPRGKEIAAAQLGPGQHFGEVELLNEQSQAIATIKAALNSAVEVLTLDRNIFSGLMAEAQSMREYLYQIVSQRLAQNQALRRGRRQLSYA
jgi:energy-coupling factor transporter ATP-binding protein EcfA2